MALLLGCALVWVIFPVANAADGTRWLPGTSAASAVAWSCAAMLVAVVCAMVVQWRRGRLDARFSAWAMGVAMFATRATYVLLTNYYVRQHDVRTVDAVDGHQAYMLYLANHGLQLPDFSPVTHWEFYHPPLWYWISGAWICLQRTLGLGDAAAVENVQLLTLFLSCGTTLLAYAILRELGIGEGRRGRVALVAAFAVCAFHPYLTILSASINNDILCLFLSLASLLWGLRWFKEPGVARAVASASLAGLAMMAKTSGFLVLAAVGVLFLVRLVEAIRSHGGVGALVRQAMAYAAVFLPLGCWWFAYCLARFGVSPGQLGSASPGEVMNVSSVPLLARFLTIDPSCLSIWEHWDWVGNTFEYNPIAMLFKGSMFDEYTLFSDGVGLVLSTALFWVNVALSLVALATLVRAIIRAARGRCQVAEPLSMGMLWLTYFLGYLVFSFAMPYACTMSFRYMVPTVLGGAYGLGSELDQGESQPLAGIACALIAAFSVLALAVYLALAFWVSR